MSLCFFIVHLTLSNGICVKFCGFFTNLPDCVNNLFSTLICAVQPAPELDPGYYIAAFKSCECHFISTFLPLILKLYLYPSLIVDVGTKVFGVPLVTMLTNKSSEVSPPTNICLAANSGS